MILIEKYLNSEKRKKHAPDLMGYAFGGGAPGARRRSEEWKLLEMIETSDMEARVETTAWVSAIK